MASDARFAPPLPTGFKIYFSGVELAGIPYHRGDVEWFVKGRGLNLELKPEPGNVADSNAVAVYGIRAGFLFKRSRLIGYVPAHEAFCLMQAGATAKVAARLRNIWVSDRGYIVVRFDIIGPKADYSGFARECGKISEEESLHGPKDSVVNEAMDEVNAVRRGLLYESAGKLDEAIESFEEAVAAEFVGNGPYDRLAVIYRRLGRKADEIRVIQRGILVFEKLAAKGLRSDAQPKLAAFRHRLERLQR